MILEMLKNSEGKNIVVLGSSYSAEDVDSNNVISMEQKVLL